MGGKGVIQDRGGIKVNPIEGSGRMMQRDHDGDDKEKKRALDIRDVLGVHALGPLQGHTDVRTARERQRLRGDIARLFEARDERGFIAALQRAGIPEPRFSEALRAWRELQRMRSQTDEKR